MSSSVNSIKHSYSTRSSKTKVFKCVSCNAGRILKHFGSAKRYSGFSFNLSHVCTLNIFVWAFKEREQCTTGDTGDI